MPLPIINRFYTVKRTHTDRNRFNAQEVKLNVSVRTPRDLSNAEFALFVTLVFRNVTETELADVQEDDIVRVVFVSESCRNHPVASVPIPRGQFNEKFLMELIKNVLNSNEEIKLDNGFTLYIDKLKRRRGGKTTYELRNCSSYSEFRKRARCMVAIDVENCLCLAACITLAMYNDQDPQQFANLRKKSRVKQLERYAGRVHENILGYAHEPGRLATLDDVRAFQAALPTFRLIIFSWSPKKQVVFVGQVDDDILATEGITENDRQNIYLVHYDTHYDLCTSPASYFSQPFCTECYKVLSGSSIHACTKKCRRCHEKTCPEQERSEMNILCKDCNRYFGGPTCLHNHKRKSGRQSQSLCEKLRLCEMCGKMKSRHLGLDGNHSCSETYCRNCKVNVDLNHKCYMKRLDRPLANDCEKHVITPTNAERMEFNQARIIYWDSETICNDETGEHEIILIMAQEGKTGKEYLFETANSFCDWAFHPRQRGATYISHNGRGYDNYFLMDWLIHHSPQRFVPICVGAKLLQLSVPNLSIKFLDSNCFIRGPLHQIPKTFDLDEDVRKGFWPYAWNKREYVNYIGAWPPLCAYEPERMEPGRRRELEIFVNENKHKEFDFNTEMKLYCSQDCTVLRKGCEEFRKMVFELCSIDAFSCPTPAALSSKIYRTHFLPEEKIAMIPENGYAFRDTQSHAALEWLSWVQYSEGCHIQCSANGREFEVRVGTQLMRLDGIKLDNNGTPTNEIYEFHGCLHHGCEDCFRHHVIHPHKRIPLERLREKTYRRKRLLEDAGYHYTECWECQWKRLKKEDPEIAEFLKTRNILTPLHPRQAFYGGRVETNTLWKQVEGDERIEYLDINSLYPFINRITFYPERHPRIFVGSNIDQARARRGGYSGLLKCKMLPPRRLFHPVLPYRFGVKIMYTLCRTCSEQKLTEKCTHNDNERALTGVWCTNELELATSKDYVMLECYEVWHFEEKSDQLFKEYMKTFIRIKFESKGYPRSCITDDDKKKYIKDFYHGEGIELRPDHIKYNPGLGEVAKLLCNSFWGKFGQRADQGGQTVFVYDEATLWDYILSPCYEVKDIHFHGDDVCQMEVRNAQDLIEAPLHANIVIAAWTTAAARCFLYETLDKLGERSLYMDTDSSIHTTKPGDWNPPIGSLLGQFKNELKKPDDYIVKFCSSGPKEYQYETAQGESTRKIKGLTLNCTATACLPFDVVEQIVCDQDRQASVPVEMGNRFRRNKKRWTITTEPNAKRFKLNYDKRIVLEDLTSIPYGYE